MLLFPTSNQHMQTKLQLVTIQMAQPTPDSQIPVMISSIQAENFPSLLH